MDIVAKISQVASELHAVGLKSIGRQVRLVIDSFYRQAMSDELKDAMAEGGLVVPQAVLGAKTILLSDNTVPDQGKYRITFFDSSTFTPDGHFYYDTPKEAIDAFSRLVNESKGIDSEFVQEMVDTVTLDGTKGKQAVLKIVAALSRNKKKKLAQNLKEALIR